MHQEIIMTNKKTSALKKLLLPLSLLIITVLAVNFIRSNPPQTKRAKPSSKSQMTVEVLSIKPQHYQVVIQSFGTVAPRTQSVLFSQVSGQINKVSAQFRAGGFFNAGDVLVELDPRDFIVDVKVAEASLISAKQKLVEEQARADQAETDWKRLGNGRVANPLVLHIPQLAAAKAEVMSAEAQLDKAELALERTRIIAPYSGRILQQNVDLGQVVSSNTSLASIYAVDYVEIRLPINNKDLPLMQLPEEYMNETASLNNIDVSSESNVVLSSNLLGKQSWSGNVVRTESAIDQTSQQLYVVAQIIKPYESNKQKGQIKIGQYVTAEILGQQVENAIVIPSSAIYQGTYVYTVLEGKLKRKEVTIGWQNGVEAIIESGLNANDKLVLTSLGQVNSGTPVSIEGEVNTRKKINTNMSTPQKGNNL